MGEIARGEQEMLSTEEMKAALAAPTPLAFWRNKRGRTQKALAEAAGVSQSYVQPISKRGGAKATRRCSNVSHALCACAVEDLVAE